MSEDRGWVAASLLLVFAVLVGTAIWIAGNTNGAAMVRSRAIEAGVAEWRVDPKTGATQFVFKGAKK